MKKEITIMRWIQELDSWNIYKKENEEVFVVRHSKGSTEVFNNKEEAKAFVLQNLYQKLEATKNVIKQLKEKIKHNKNDKYETL